MPNEQDRTIDGYLIREDFFQDLNKLLQTCGDVIADKLEFPDDIQIQRDSDHRMMLVLIDIMRLREKHLCYSKTGFEDAS